MRFYLISIYYTYAQGFNTIYKPKVGGLRFSDLLDKVSLIDPEMRIRFTSPHPKDFPDEVLQVIKERNNICNQIHMPAQSGSSAILEKMRRGYTREHYLELADRIRGFIPGVSLSTDMISGFCGETEEDHLATLSLMRMVKYENAFLFAYSMRKKTHAYHRMKDDVPEEVKKQRLREIIDLYHELLPKILKKNVGQTQLVLVEGISKKSRYELAGRNDGNTKVIFQDVALPHYISKDQCKGKKTKIKNGDYVVVEITESLGGVLKGRPIGHCLMKEFYNTSELRS